MDSKSRNAMVIKILSGFTAGHLLLMLILLFSPIDARGQVVNGRVVDSESGEAVSFASVYLSGTTVGTISNDNGEFELNISRHPSIPLTISAIGYLTVTLDDISSNEFVKIYLSPRSYEITPIAISTRSLERERRANLRMFRNQFLGTTLYARKCEILNEEDITFNYGSDRDTLKAYVLKPLQIRNGALGYIITFDLERFEFYRRTGAVLYTGTFIFRDSPGGGSYGSLSERRRNTAFFGSALHFFQSLWVNDLKGQGFSVRDHLGNALSYDDIVISRDGNKYLWYREDLTVYYLNNTSWIQFREGSRVYFEKSGYFDPVAIMFTGEMGRTRVGDLLPLGFVPR
jgi:hypothetical protein